MQYDVELGKYKEKKARLEEERSALERSFLTISTLRIISFMAGAALIFIGISDGVSPALYGGVLLLAVFFYLVYKHNTVAKNTEAVERRLKVVGKYIDRFGEGWRQFEDDGSLFLKADDTVAHDLDLLGPNSLYQLINVCHSKKGKQKLSDAIRMGNGNADTSKAVEELAGLTDFGIEFETAGIKLDAKKQEDYADTFIGMCMDEQNSKLPAWARVISVVLPVLEITLLILFLMGILSYGPALAGFIVILSITWLTKSITDGIIVPFFQINRCFEGYREMLGLISVQEFKTEALKRISENLNRDDGILKGFKSLERIIQAYNISFNPLIHQILSGFFMWDYRLAGFALKWKQKYKDAVASSFDAVSDVEQMLSLSTISKVRNTCSAVIENTDEVYVKGADMYHPLISVDKAVANSAHIREGVTIITGSNMSGKTTFLRTVAINLILAYMGAPVCAKEFSASNMKVFTSMRITDDVAEGISTFYAEILRIKAMADFRKNDVPMICFIDEIFKGTNSADRIVGAKEVIKGLGGKKCITLVSTHDFELCEVKDREGKPAVNYHFEEHYEDDKLSFDYTIKNGRCTTTNARAILKMAGFNVQL